MRAKVVTEVRSNQHLENDLNLMDIKIGLLVKNRITLQVSTHCRAPVPAPREYHTGKRAGMDGRTDRETDTDRQTDRQTTRLAWTDG